MSPSELAELVESSEARAYSSLVQLPLPPDNSAHGTGRPSVQRFGSAVALVTPSIKESLNLNRVIGLGIAEATTTTTLDAIDDPYRGLGLSYAIEVGPCAGPAELPLWIRQRGLRRSVSTTMFWRRAMDTPDVSSRHRVGRAVTPREFEILARIACAVFRMPAMAQTLLAATRRDSRWRGWLAWQGGIPVAAALSFVQAGTAWFGWDATLPEFRRHGAQRALIAARVGDALARGCRHVTCETASHTAARPDPSGRNCEALGFSLAYSRSTYVALHSRPCAAAGPAGVAGALIRPSQSPVA